MNQTNMKTAMTGGWFAVVLGLVLAAAGVRAQSGDTNPTVGSADRQGQVVASPATSQNADTVAGPGVPAVADRLKELPQQIRERLLEFEKQREAYLKQQSDLLRQLKGANDEQREKIREQLRLQRHQWLEQAQQFREQARERLLELKDRLPQHQEVLDAARERAREQLRNAADQRRDRRGTD